jgi:uncharacterized short protein YbdD (DUF466 family)
MQGRRTGGQAEGRTEGTRPGWTVRLSQTLRQVAGMPDYQRYLEHLQRCHPDRPIPTEKDYYQEFLGTRYQDGPTRCC